MARPQGDIDNLLKNLPNSVTVHPRGKEVTVANTYGSLSVVMKKAKLHSN